MNTNILSIDPVIIEEMPEELTTLPVRTEGAILRETPLPLTSRFGIADLWKIRSVRKHFIFYR